MYLRLVIMGRKYSNIIFLDFLKGEALGSSFAGGIAGLLSATGLFLFFFWTRLVEYVPNCSSLSLRAWTVEQSTEFQACARWQREQ